MCWIVPTEPTAIGSHVLVSADALQGQRVAAGSLGRSIVPRPSSITTVAASANFECGLRANSSIISCPAMMSHASPLMEANGITMHSVDSSMSQEHHDSVDSRFGRECGRNVVNAGFENDRSSPLPENEPLSGKTDLPLVSNGTLEVGFQKPPSADDALFHDRKLLPLTDFLDAARKTSLPQMAKRPRTYKLESEAKNVDFTIKQAADIVLILAGLGLIRAGRAPTDIERELLAEAYGRLGFLVQKLVPRDLVSVDSIETLIDDLGLRLTQEEQGEAVMPLSEESTPPMQADQIGQSQEVIGGSLASIQQVVGDGKDAESLSQDVQVQALSFPGSTQAQPVSSVVHSPTLPSQGSNLDRRRSMSALATSASAREQMISAASGNNLDVVRLAVPAEKDGNFSAKVDVFKLRLQGGHKHFEDQVSASSSISTVGQDNMLVNGTQKQAEISGAQLTHKQLTRALQDLMQSRHSVEADLPAAHPKSFMSAPVPCEICKMTVRDTGSVLICDLCEKVHHLRCLQQYQLKGIPKADWYCPKCAIESQGRHPIPKYRPVREGFSFLSSFQGSAGSFHEAGRSSGQLDSAHRQITPVDVPLGSLPGSGVERQTGRKHLMAIGSSDHHNGADKSSATLTKAVMDGSSRTYETQSVGGSFTALLDSFTQAEIQQQSHSLNVAQPLVQLQSQIPSHSHIQTTDRLAYFNPQLGQQPTMQSIPHAQLQGSKIVTRAGTISGTDGLLHIEGADSNLQPVEASTEIAHSNSILRAGVSNYSEQSKSGEAVERFAGASKGLEPGVPYRFGREADFFGVEWVGDVVQRFDGKDFYTACSVGGFLYKLQDCALFRPETPGVPPYIARLQALWEDTATGSKWVRVNWCYYPSDIPLMVGRPANPVTNEVYESNHGDNNLVGSIQGPCLVLRPESYAKEMERRHELLRSGRTNEDFFPIFLCRWLYDAPRASFKVATEGIVMM